MAKHPIDSLARFAQALAAPTRIRIVELLRGRPLCVNALAARLNVTQGAVSQHLRVLREAGIVASEKRGCFVHYRLDDEGITAWRSEVMRLLTVRHGACENDKGASECRHAKKKNDPARGPRT